MRVLTVFLTTLTLLFVACGSTDSDGRSSHIDTGTESDVWEGDTDQTRVFTLEGKVVALQGVPLRKGRVALFSEGRVSLIDQDGRFRFESVTSPYDIAIIDEARRTSVTIYQGLTVQTPTLTHWYRLEGDRQASLRGTFSGVFDSAAVRLPNVGLMNDDDVGLGWDSSSASTLGPYSFSLRWHDNPEISVFLTGIQQNNDGSLIGIGRGAPFFIRHGDELTDLNIELDSVETTPIDVRITHDEDLEVYTEARIRFGASRAGLRLRAGLLQRQTLHLPRAEGMAPSIIVWTREPDTDASAFAVISDIDLNEGTIDVTAPSIPELTTPPNGASSVGYTTNFAWDDPDATKGFVYALTLDGLVDRATSIRLVTREQSVFLPDLRAFGISLEPGAVHRWLVEKVGPFEDLDEAVASSRLANEASATTFMSERTAVHSDFMTASSIEREFFAAGTPDP